MKAREIRKLERARAHREVKEYSKRINRAFSRLSEECSNKVIRATSLDFPRDYVACEPISKPNRVYYSDANPFGNKIHAVQKMKLSSKPLI